MAHDRCGCHSAFINGGFAYEEWNEMQKLHETWETFICRKWCFCAYEVIWCITLNGLHSNLITITRTHPSISSRKKKAWSSPKNHPPCTHGKYIIQPLVSLSTVLLKKLKEKKKIMIRLGILIINSHERMISKNKERKRWKLFANAGREKTTRSIK